MTDTELTEASVLELAAKFDNGQDVDTPATPVVAETQQAKEPADKSVEAEAKNDTEAKEVEKSAETGKENEAKGTEKSDAEEKSRWTKNRERKEKTWEEINAEKAAIKAEKEALMREKEQIQKAKITQDVYRDEHGATAKDYREAAKALREKGNAEMADAAEKLAANIEAKESQLKQQKVMEELAASWKKNYESLSEKHPELKNQESPLYKETVAVLNEFKLLAQNPDGLRYAVKAAEVNLQAKEFDGTKAEYAKLKAEYEKLQKKLTIAGGAPTAPIAEKKSFDQMSLKEQEAHLEKAAFEHDRALGYA